jgi:hypothetical protein
MEFLKCLKFSNFKLSIYSNFLKVLLENMIDVQMERESVSQHHLDDVMVAVTSRIHVKTF